jgi:hypothetical protein
MIFWRSASSVASLSGSPGFAVISLRTLLAFTFSAPFTITSLTDGLGHENDDYLHAIRGWFAKDADVRYVSSGIEIPDIFLDYLIIVRLAHTRPHVRQDLLLRNVPPGPRTARRSISTNGAAGAGCWPCAVCSGRRAAAMAMQSDRGV